MTIDPHSVRYDRQLAKIKNLQDRIRDEQLRVNLDADQQRARKQRITAYRQRILLLSAELGTVQESPQGSVDSKPKYP